MNIHDRAWCSFSSHYHNVQYPTPPTLEYARTYKSTHRVRTAISGLWSLDIQKWGYIHRSEYTIQVIMEDFPYKIKVCNHTNNHVTARG